MEFQISEAIELVKTLAETENLTHTQALTAFFYEADLCDEDAAILKASFFEDYTLKEMAVDSLANVIQNVFVTNASKETEELSEVDTKETGEGTKYKVRVKDRASNSSYVRYATRQKIAELRANPNISSVELTDHGEAGEDNDGSRTAAAKRGGSDRDGDGTVETSSKEHAGVVHNAIQRKMGGKPDGQDTRRESFDIWVNDLLEEGYDLSNYTWGDMYAFYKEESDQGYNDRLDDALGSKNGKKKQSKKDRRDESEAMEKKNGKNKYAGDKEMDDESDDESCNEEYGLEEEKREANLEKMRRKEDKHMKDAVKQRGGSRGDSKNRSMKMAGIRDAIERGEDPRRDTNNGHWTAKTGPRSPKDHRTSYTTNSEPKPAKKPGVKKESYDQGYNDRLDDSLGSKNGKKKQSMKDRRDESEAMEKKNGKNKYAGDKEMDDESCSSVKKESAWDHYLQLRENRRAARAAGGYKDDSKKQTDPSKAGFTGISNSIEDIKRQSAAMDKEKAKKKVDEDYLPEGDLVNAGSESTSERKRKKLTGENIDNSKNIKLMPNIGESVITSTSSKSLTNISVETDINTPLRSKIKEMYSSLEEVSEIEEIDVPRKKGTEIDESGMPILEYSRNDSTGPTPEMINPGKDPEGETGVFNPKGKPKRFKKNGEAPGDRRPNIPSGPELPFDKGTVPNGAGV